MKKLRLDTDNLRVEPFHVEAAAEENGTVVGNQYSRYYYCDTQPAASCGYPATCGGTSCDSGYPVCRQCNVD